MSTRWLVQLGILAVLAVPAAAAAERPLRIAAAGAAVGEWSARVDRLLGSRELVSRLTREDTMLAGRTHERLAQLHRGVPVFGGELVRQSDAARHAQRVRHLPRGHRRRREPGARRGAGRGARRGAGRQAVRATGRPRARGAAAGRRLSAGLARPCVLRRALRRAPGVPRRRRPASSLAEWSDVQRQTAAIGTGVLGDQKKLSVSSASGGFTTADRLRPPLISSYDFRFNVDRLIQLLDRRHAREPDGRRPRARRGQRLDRRGDRRRSTPTPATPTTTSTAATAAAASTTPTFRSTASRTRSAARTGRATRPTRCSTTSPTPSTSATASPTTATACRRTCCCSGSA